MSIQIATIGPEAIAAQVAAQAAIFDDGYEPVDGRLFATAGVLAANAAYLQRFRLPENESLVGATIYTGDHTGNAVIAVMAESGAEYAPVAISASTELTVTNGTQRINFTTPGSGTAGTDYWFLLAPDNATATFLRLSGGAPVGLAGRKALIRTSWLPTMANIAISDVGAPVGTNVTPWFRLEFA